MLLKLTAIEYSYDAYAYQMYRLQLNRNMRELIKSEIRNGRIVHLFGAVRMCKRYDFCAELIIFDFIKSKKFLYILLCSIHKS